METIRLIVNDREHDLVVHPHETLAQVLRDRIQLTGTKLGCEQASCGACTVRVDGQVVQSCITPVMRVNGSRITTIEGIAPEGGGLHPLQEKFVEKGAIQCGYCTPGMIMAACSLLKDNPDPSEQEVREGLEGNLCRCTGYQNIVKAVQAAAQHTAGAAAEPADQPAVAGGAR